MVRIAINGCGRIGRCIIRALFESGLDNNINLVAVNDLADIKLNSHLMQFDSSHGVFNKTVENHIDRLIIGETNIRYFCERDPAALPWGELNIDIVLECSGAFKQRGAIDQHLCAGAKKVLVGHPLPEADFTAVFGVNHEKITQNHKVVSNASCTTNCLAPMVKVLHEALTIKQGNMTTVHAYTNDQSLVDKAPGDFYRSRSATQSIIPTRTGAASAVGLVIPELAGKLNGMALRVPTPNVSIVDLHCVVNEVITDKALNKLFVDAVETFPKGVMDTNALPLVSIDFNHNLFSCVVDTQHSNVLNDQIKVMAWYDNEWGFANRMLDILQHMHKVGYPA